MREEIEFMQLTIDQFSYTVILAIFSWGFATFLTVTPAHAGVHSSSELEEYYARWIPAFSLSLTAGMLRIPPTRVRGMRRGGQSPLPVPSGLVGV